MAMDESEDKQGQAEPKPRCNPKQLELLKKSSEKKDMTEWNNWRKENPEEEIWLEGVDLHNAHLEGAILDHAHLERANLWSAHLEGAYLFSGHLKNTHLGHAHLQRANLSLAHLEGARLEGAHLEGAHLAHAHLEGAVLGDNTFLERAVLEYAHLERATLWRAQLQGANFTASSVDGSTLFWSCYVDRKTDFRSVGLDSCRIDEGTKYLLEYNKRRMNWQDWYRGESQKKWLRKMRKLLTPPVRLFWFLSDYGCSTIRILTVFLALAIAFALAYWAKPACVMVNGQVGGLRNFLHALYFSVVTMTTLGFGDIAANPQSSCGQVLLMLQVFCGYFLLGAIITRLSILFTAGGPAGRFSKRRKNEQIKR